MMHPYHACAPCNERRGPARPQRHCYRGHARDAATQLSNTEAHCIQGTIDNHATYAIFEAVALLADSKAWTKEDHAALVQWFSKYIHHLQSNHCRNESLQENNHGTYFDVQYLSVLSFLGRCELRHHRHHRHLRRSRQALAASALVGVQIGNTAVSDAAAATGCACICHGPHATVCVCVCAGGRMRSTTSRMW